MISDGVMVDSWSWFPRTAAHGTLESMAGAKAANKDSAASLLLDPNMLSPARNQNNGHEKENYWIGTHNRQEMRFHVLWNLGTI